MGLSQRCVCINVSGIIRCRFPLSLHRHFVSFIFYTSTKHMRPFQAKNLLFCLLLLLPGVSIAGEIFGTLKKDGKPMVKQEVKIMQGDKVIATAVTDATGYFTITIKQIGKFTIVLPGYEGATFEVFSTNNSSGYTLSLIKTGDKWQLKKQ